MGESNTANNIEVSDAAFPYLFQFGNVGARKNVPLAIGSGGALQLTLGGAGTGAVAPDGALLDMVFNNTDGTSAAKLTAKPGFGINFDDITANSPLGSLNIFASNVRGDLKFNGGIGSLIAGAIDPTGFSAGDATFTIGTGLGKAPKLDIFALGDVDLTSAVGIAQLSTHLWRDANGSPDTITAPFIDKLRVTPAPQKTGTVPLDSEFAADLQLSSNGPSGFALKTALIKGKVIGATWNINGAAGLNVDLIGVAEATGWTVKASGRMEDFVVVGTWDNTGNLAAFEAQTAGNLVIGDALKGGGIKIHGSDAKGIAAKSIKIGQILGFQQIEAQGGTIGVLETDRWTNGALLAGALGTLKVKGDPKVSGDTPLSNVMFNFTKPDGVTKLFSVLGGMNTVDIKAPSGYGFEAILAGNWLLGSLTAGSAKNIRILPSYHGAGNLVAVDIDLKSAGLSLGKLTVNHSIASVSTIKLGGMAGDISVGAMLDSTFEAAGDVKNFLVKGFKEGAAPFFSGSTVTGKVFGKILVNDVATAGTNIGFIATKIKSYTREEGGQVAALLKEADFGGAGNYDVQGAFRVHIK